ncbi:MAG: acetyl-CoA carboxylase biotin carboxyl carrier protein [Gammaproteobacteria bacterium]|jgi:acetyl-CoA carboxylase biotin carboxyl carrier protein
MDIRKVKKLIELLEESGVAEIEIHEGEESVRISRGNPAMFATPTLVQAPPPTPTAVQAPASASSVDQEPEIVGDVVTSPMVGIFYEALAPGKPVFVELGQSVKKGDVLCIIEAMKIMNQVESEYNGVISKIMIENGDPVEYGQPLFVIREK